MYLLPVPKSPRAFTLIELLIVVAIIAILAAIAVPNFLEAQTRAKVSRAKADMRSITTAIESYRVDNNKYPQGTDNPTLYDEKIVAFLTPFNLQGGFYGMRTRGGVAGQDFYTVTTPIAYITSIPEDPFSSIKGVTIPYAYRMAGITNAGWVLTSVGPDSDLLGTNNSGRGNNKVDNPYSTSVDPKSSPRLGDVNERAVVRPFDNEPGEGVTAADFPRLIDCLLDLSYDPTNGTISDGDLIRIGPGGRIPGQ
jgi:prepilin-type N-terminal cleavage/methylation domain-containing protein